MLDVDDVNMYVLALMLDQRFITILQYNIHSVAKEHVSYVQFA